MGWLDSLFERRQALDPGLLNAPQAPIHGQINMGQGGERSWLSRVDDIARGVMGPAYGQVKGAADFLSPVNDLELMQQGGRKIFDGSPVSGMADYATGLLSMYGPGDEILDAAKLAMAAGPAARKARGLFQMDYFDTPVSIFQNPSKAETQGFLNRTKYKAARRITDPKTGDVYIWDAADPAMHQLVAEKLGVDTKDPKYIADTIGID